MKLFNKVVIIGTGLIGGSMALAIKKKRIAKVVVGVSRHRKTLILAKMRGAIDVASGNLNIVKDADLIIFATPINAILKIAKKISPVVSETAIVTDVGSTKEKIVSSLGKLFSRYVGSHPLAGSEKRGILNANADIFNNSLCILTPNKNTHQPSFKKLSRLWNMLGAEVVCLEPKLHDDVLSFVSHLPHLTAFILSLAVPKKFLSFAASGFKDATRIASSEAGLWKDIFITNRSSLLKALAVFKRNLSRIEVKIKRGDNRGLERELKKAKTIRDSLK